MTAENIGKYLDSVDNLLRLESHAKEDAGRSNLRSAALRLVDAARDHAEKPSVG